MMEELLLPSNKITKINLKVILDNYLDTEFWKFKWNLFEYDGYLFTLSIDTIDIKSNRVVLRTQGSDDYINYGYVSIPLGRTLEEVEGTFRLQLINSVLSRISYIEYCMITETDAYQRAEELEEDRRIEVDRMATELLDSLNITHDAIRSAYIKQQRDNNSTSYVDEVRERYSNKLRPDIYRSFLILYGDDKRLDDYEVDDDVQSKIDEFIKNIEYEEIVLEDIESGKD